MEDAELLKPIVKFLLKKRKIGKKRPNNFSGKIIFLFSEIKSEVPGLRKLSQLRKLLNSLEQKDCWLNNSRQGAVHDYKITKGTIEANNRITVDCTTGFLSAKKEDLGGQIEEEAELTKKIIIITNNGIRIKNCDNAIYPISGKRKELVNFLLKSDNPSSAKKLTEEFSYTITVLSDEINTINKIFSNKFKDCIDSDIRLIINKPRGSGYRSNSENFKFKFK